ncbi:MAG: DNA repair protein RadA [Thermodesulfobacterium sp.]|nr:DNA repair protein RadA [Thermodesulfobacterium sp.]NAZ29897.1 hypothetical protein [Caldimicrobium sp.]
MAVWKCSQCGATKESRCKPKKCPSCGAENTMTKAEGQGESSSSCKGRGKKSCKS